MTVLLRSHSHVLVFMKHMKQPPQRLTGCLSPPFCGAWLWAVRLMDSCPVHRVKGGQRYQRSTCKGHGQRWLSLSGSQALPRAETGGGIHAKECSAPNPQTSVCAPGSPPSQVSDDVLAHPERHSLLPLPHPFVVPGDRFREVYYWDSYWVSGCTGVMQLVHCSHCTVWQRSICY